MIGCAQLAGIHEEIMAMPMTYNSLVGDMETVTVIRIVARQMLALEYRQGIAALSQQTSARQNQLTETRFALSQLPTVMAQKVQTLRNDLATTEPSNASVCYSYNPAATQMSAIAWGKPYEGEPAPLKDRPLFGSVPDRGPAVAAGHGGVGRGTLTVAALSR